MGCCSNDNESKIHCEVENCVFHDKFDKCTATQIDVGPQSACAVKETNCGTFREK